MPIIRHFVFVGGRLALLFAAIEHPAPADPDRTIIRIHPARSVPEKNVSVRASMSR